MTSALPQTISDEQALALAAQTRSVAQEALKAAVAVCHGVNDKNIERMAKAEGALYAAIDRLAAMLAVSGGGAKHLASSDPETHQQAIADQEAAQAETADKDKRPAKGRRAIVTVTDDGNRRVDININFGDSGVCDDSVAHKFAVAMLTYAGKALGHNHLEGDDEEDE